MTSAQPKVGPFGLLFGTALPTDSFAGEWRCIFDGKAGVSASVDSQGGVRFSNDGGVRYAIVREGDEYFCNEYKLNKRRSNANQLRWALTNPKQHQRANPNWPKVGVWTRVNPVFVKSKADQAKELVQEAQAKAQEVDPEKSPKKAGAVAKVMGLATKVPADVITKAQLVGTKVAPKVFGAGDDAVEAAA